MVLKEVPVTLIGGPSGTIVKQSIKKYQAPVVRKVDSSIHWINDYPVDSAIGLRNTYRLDSDLSGG